MTTSILGIDPGLSGAITLLSPDGSLEVRDIPTLQLKKRVIDEYALARIIDDWSNRVREVWLEQVATRPGEGSVGAFTFGRGYGLIRGICAANFLTIMDVTPSTWKRALGVPAEKDGARACASKIFPRYADNWSRVKDDGRAESALIAHYGMLKLREGIAA